MFFQAEWYYFVLSYILHRGCICISSFVLSVCLLRMIEKVLKPHCSSLSETNPKLASLCFETQFGFMDMNFDASMGMSGNSAADDDEDDADLEAELAALTSGSSSSKPKKGMPLLCNCNENNQCL